MRDTRYARELATGRVDYSDGSSACIERLLMKENNEVEIRFSWWKAGGRLMPRPLDLGERDLLLLVRQAVERDVFSAEFLRGLRETLSERG